MSKRQDYIDRYAEAAMEQMKRYGIPASIILAQGIIESGDGGSELSRLHNNHFGIKATKKWIDSGGKYGVYTDDKPNEKFCSYPTVADSFEHHSQFLKENARYAALFKLSPDDHEGWANGLQQAGYATGKKYAQTLEAIIKANGLDKYDQQVMAEMKGQGIGQKPKSTETPAVTARAQATGHYAFPIDSKEFLLVTSPFGMRTDPMDHSKQQMHKGIDLRANHAVLKATEDGGRVLAIGNDVKSSGGRSVTVEYDRDDGSKVRVFSCHLDSIDVKVGDVVKAGQQLGITGNTGSRTTGPHLHMAVKQIASDGAERYVDPVSYLADIAHKGGIPQQVLHNGENVLLKYQPQEERQEQVAEEVTSPSDMPLSPMDWMTKLLSSEDAGASPSMSSDPLMDLIINIFSTLMALALGIDNQSREQQMQRTTEAALNRRIDLSGLVQGVKECELHWPENGNPKINVTIGSNSYSHSLTENEIRNLSAVLQDNTKTDAEKQQRLNSLVAQIVVQQQVTNNYEQNLEHGETQGLQR